MHGMKPYVDFRIARRSTVTMQVHTDLRRRIVSGELPPKSSLTENEIAQRYGVSRTPAREVLGRLEEEGLVEIYPQYGTFIAPIRLADVRDSQFVRESLECAALSRALQLMQPDDASAFRQLIEEQCRLIPLEDVRFIEADERLHAMFFRIAGHERAWQVVAGAKLQLDRVRFLSSRDAAKRESIVAEHGAIVDCIGRDDRPGAIEALRGHLRGALDSVTVAMRSYPEFFSDAADGMRNAATKSRLDRKAKSIQTLA